MKTINRFFFLVLGFILPIQFSFATTSVTPLSATPVFIGFGTGCSNSNGTITISGTTDADQTAADFKIGTNRTYRIQLPVGFKFGNNLATDISVTSSDGSKCTISSVTFANSKRDFEFTYSIIAPASGSTAITITISNINIVCTIPGSTGKIYRIASTTTGAVDGDMSGNNPNDNVSHGELDSRINTTIVGNPQRKYYYYDNNTNTFKYSSTSSFSTLTSASPTYSLCADTAIQYAFRLSTPPSAPAITSYRLYENGSYTGINSNTNSLVFNPPNNKNGLFYYTIAGRDNSGCLYKCMDSIDIQHKPIPDPASFIQTPASTPTDQRHDTIFSKTDDPRLLNGYMQYPTGSPNSVLRYDYSWYGVEDLGSNIYQFNPGIASLGTYFLYYTATNGTCNTQYRLPYRFTVYDPSQLPKSWISFTGNQPPFCEDEGDISFTINAPSGKTIRYLYIYKYNGTVSFYDYTSSTPPTSMGPYLVNTKAMKSSNNTVIYIYVEFYEGTDPNSTNYEYDYSYITLFPKRDVKIMGLPKPVTGLSNKNDSTIVLCGSSKDTLFTRFIPENGKMEYFKRPAGATSDVPIGAFGTAPVNDPYFRKMVPYDIYKKVANEDTSVALIIRYIYPPNNPQLCPDTLIRRIKFNKPIEVKDTIISPTQPPYCLNDNLIINVKYPSNATYSSADRFIWNFGDGNGNITDSIQTMKYKYMQPGKFAMRFRTNLSSMPTGACNNDLIDTLRIGTKPIADFDIYQNFEGEISILKSRSRNTTLNPDTTATDRDNIYRWYWDMGNGYTTTKTIDSLHYQYNSIQRVPFPIVHIVTSGWGCTDTITKHTPVFNIKTPNPTLSYFEDFNNDTEANSWYASGWYKRDTLKSSWRNEIANGRRIKADTNNLSWITSGYSLDNSTAKNNSYIVTYEKDEVSWVESPVFNLSALQLPMVSLSTWVNSDKWFDGACLQYTICDSVAFGKEKWMTLGQFKEGANYWYNSYTIVSQPGGSLNGWTADTAKAWNFSAYRLNEIKDTLTKYNAKYVRFRLVFASNRDNSPDRNFDGFAFDNFMIGQRNRKVLVEEFCDYGHYEPNITNYFKDPSAIRIQYHTSSFKKDDELNLDNPADPSARALLYGIGKGLPRGVIDGIYSNNEDSLHKWGPDAFFERSLMQSPFAITVKADTVNKKVQIKGTISKTSNKPLTGSYAVHFAVVEKSVTGNGIKFTNVLRSLVPNSGGHHIPEGFDWNNKDTTITVNWSPFSAPEDSLMLIVFIQDENSREVYQSMYDTLTFDEVKNLPSVMKSGSYIPSIPVSINDLYLSPNPTSGELKVLFNGVTMDTYSWTILNQLGQELQSGKINNGTNAMILDVNELASGFYYLKVEGEGQRMVKKFSVVK